MDLLTRILKAKEYILNQSKYTPSIGLILGSGLGSLADSIENPEFFSYSDIPGFPVSTVEGHKGRLVIGTLQDKTVIAMDGRFHYYEGYNMAEVTIPIRVMKLLGIKTLIVTNAAGAVNTSFVPGDLMIITDHINLSGANPLIGKNLDDFGPRFPDMSQAYTPDYQATAKAAAEKLGLDLKEGVYMGYSGPTYETPAEIRMSRTIGADAVGMSTVPEVIVAAHSGLKVLGISCITNLAAGMQANLSHEEVVETTQRVKQSFKALVKETLTLL